MKNYFLSGESRDAVCKFSWKSAKSPGGVQKSRFLTFCKFAEKKHMDIKFLNVR